MKMEHKFVCHYLVKNTFIIYYSVYSFNFEVILKLIICPVSSIADY